MHANFYQGNCFMAGDIFSTETWFANLLNNGFVKKPYKYFVMQLQSSVADEANFLHLMQQKKDGPFTSLANYYSGLYGPTGELENLQDLSLVKWQSAAEFMRSAGGAVIRIQPLEAESQWVDALQNGFKATGYWTDRFFCFANWYQNVPSGGFKAYWSQRPGALQNSVERGRRRLCRAGSWHIKIYTQEAADLEQAIAAYEKVYAQSWKSPEPCVHFMPSLLRIAAYEGWLRLGILWLEEQPLAVQVWLVYRSKANIYKLAYAQGMERFSPGSVLTAALMEHVMDIDNVQEVDYLSGDDHYKRDWMEERRERIGLLAFDKCHWRGWLAASLHFFGRWAKNTDSIGVVQS